MHETISKNANEATKADGQSLRADAPAGKAESNQRQIRTGLAGRQSIPRIHFRDLALMAFPTKTDAHLAFVARVDARTARRWLADDTEPPADVLGIILAEIMRRYAQRD